MGQAFRKLFDSIFGNREMRVSPQNLRPMDAANTELDTPPPRPHPPAFVLLASMAMTPGPSDENGAKPESSFFQMGHA